MIPVLVSKRNSSYTVQLVFSPNIQSSNYSEWKALHAVQESFDNAVCDLIDMYDNKTDELNQMFYSPLCNIDCFRVRFSIFSRTYNIWLPIVYWSEGENHYLCCPLLEQFRYMSKDEDISAETAEYYLQCWLRKENNSSSKEEFIQKVEFLTKQFSEKHNYYIRLIDVVFHDKLYYTWSKSHLPRRNMSATEELKTIAEPIIYHPNSYDELAFSGDYKFVRIPANDKLSDFYARIYRALMDGCHRKGVLIVGQELSGRSFAIDTVLRTIQRDVNYKKNDNNILVRRNEKNYISRVWKLSGSGIISGMSIVGQWKARAESIFSYAEDNDLILYFESLLDLTEEGKTELSSFSVADALMSYMKEKKIRVVSRITPTQLVKLRERNRSFVNQFEILTMPALSAEEQLRLYISKIQSWKNADSSERSPFELISYMSQLVEWTNPNGGAPGSVCKWLDKISNRPSNNAQDDLLSQIGANFPLLKNELSPNSQEIKKELSGQVIGQEEAIDALTNWTLKFQALLSDPGRPAATMLFLGPTGVGKTESAKAVARFLYKDDNHFLRFDCNELNSSNAVLHLVGSARFEGSLTNAVRFEPFSVVLFDEIEKAHPAFHDLLLQILGEGRLTDGKGRTVSFKNCFIILTSNLGASQTGRFAGFGDVSQNDRDVYFKALERFFRPEFINRLDKVVPFNRLGNSELELIARKFIDQISSREGFQKRKALLSISPTALDWLVQQGHDPKYGARQTQRSLERILVEPLSAFFARSSWDTISVIEIGCENDKLTYSISPIAPSKKPKGALLTSDMFDDITIKDYNVFYSALLDWINKIKGLFLPSDSSDENLIDWGNMDDSVRLRLQIQEELDSLKNDLELVATISDSSQRGIDNKLNRHITAGWDSRVQKISAPKPLSQEEWNLLLQSESGVFPQNVKLTQVDPVRSNALLEALSRCAKIHQLLASGIPQPEEALIAIFSTGESTHKARRDAPINKLIQQFADDNCSPIRLQQHTYNLSQCQKTLYYHAQGLGAYERLVQCLSGVYVMFDSIGRLSRADSLIILPFDSKQQTPDECIKKFLESKPKIWNELRYMYINDSFYESLDARKYFDLPPELTRALSHIIH